MATITPFPSTVPVLKLSRSAEKWAATLAEERVRLQEDHDLLREREGNLREYESRLRALQAEIEVGRDFAASRDGLGAFRDRTPPPPLPRLSAAPPSADAAALQLGWEKLHRAREIVEAEQKNQRDDRIAMAEVELRLKRREEVVAAREARLAEREGIVAAAPAPALAREELSTVARFARAPIGLARSVFGGKRGN